MPRFVMDEGEKERKKGTHSTQPRPVQRLGFLPINRQSSRVLVIYSTFERLSFPEAKSSGVMFCGEGVVKRGMGKGVTHSHNSRWELSMLSIFSMLSARTFRQKTESS